MKFNLNTIRKMEQAIFKAFKALPLDKVSFVKLTGRITGSEVYFLIHNAKTYEAYVDIEYLIRTLNLSKSQIFKLIDENNILIDSNAYRSGIHYYLSIEDVEFLVNESAVTNKEKHLSALQSLFNAVLEQHAKSH